MGITERKEKRESVWSVQVIRSFQVYGFGYFWGFFGALGFGFFVNEGVLLSVSELWCLWF